MATIKKIKNDAIVDVKIGSGFLQRLQKVMLNIVMDKSPDDLADFKTKSEEFATNSNPEFEESWMDDLFTMSILINQIEKNMIDAGLTYEEELPDIKVEDDLLQDQSPEQPE